MLPLSLHLTDYPYALFLKHILKGLFNCDELEKSIFSSMNVHFNFCEAFFFFGGGGGAGGRFSVNVTVYFLSHRSHPSVKIT